MLLGEVAERVVVDGLGVLPHQVRDYLERLAGVVERVAVGEVATVGEVHSEDHVARLAGCEVHGHVGLRAGVRLNVGVVAAKELLGPVPRQLLRHVHELAPSVVALGGVALGVLVGHHRAHCRQNRGRDEIFRGDQLQAVILAPALVAESRGNLGVYLANGSLENPKKCGALVLVHR